MKHIIIALTMAAFVAAANAGEGCDSSKEKADCPAKGKAECKEKAKAECPGKANGDKSDENAKKSE